MIPYWVHQTEVCWNRATEVVGILRACNEATSNYIAIQGYIAGVRTVEECAVLHGTDNNDMAAIIQIYMGIHTGESRRP